MDTYYPQLRTVGTNYVWRNLSQEVGDIVVFRYKSGIQHFAKVMYHDDNTLYVRDANYKHCEVTDRVIDRNDPSIKGYYTP